MSHILLFPPMRAETHPCKIKKHLVKSFVGHYTQINVNTSYYYEAINYLTHKLVINTYLAILKNILNCDIKVPVELIRIGLQYLCRYIIVSILIRIFMACN